ncbi:MAG TPA: enoyl-CoA hydratase/isomerase family protein [Terriglobia bacterium]|nr:enoyl-CoA hydratase/isomerase family protein [Terriglobia bacterium]
MSSIDSPTRAIWVERHGAVARLVLDRPAAGGAPLNVLDLETIRELNARLGEALGDESVRLVEIRGRKSFSAGVEIRDHFPERAPEMLLEFHTLVRSVLYARCPTVAVVRGYCLGGGMELACACDFIVASKEAQFGQPEIKVGCFPPVAAVLLPRLIPEKRAMEMILIGEPISGEEAYRLGLVNRLAESASLDEEVEKFASALLNQSSAVLTLARKASRLGSREEFESALRESERIYLEELLKLEDATDGLRAFLEKRPPAWRQGGMGAGKG